MTHTGQSPEVLLAALRGDFPTVHDDARIRRKLAAAGAAVGAGTLVGTAAQGVAQAAAGATVATLGTPGLSGAAGATVKAVAGAKSGGVLASWSALATSTKAVVAAGTIAVGAAYPAVRYVEGLDGGPKPSPAATARTTQGASQSETAPSPARRTPASQTVAPPAASLQTALRGTALQETALRGTSEPPSALTWPERRAVVGAPSLTPREAPRVVDRSAGARRVNPRELSASAPDPAARRAALGAPIAVGAGEPAIGAHRAHDAVTASAAAVPLASESQGAQPVNMAPLGGSTLREEAALIESALRATQQHDMVAARRSLDEHERRFPNGLLVQERARLRAALR